MIRPRGSDARPTSGAPRTASTISEPWTALIATKPEWRAAPAVRLRQNGDFACGRRRRIPSTPSLAQRFRSWRLRLRIPSTATRAEAIVTGL